MTLIAIFAISGLSILVLLTAKSIEKRRKKSLFILSAISKGDIRVRELWHKALDTYSSGKERALFLLTKQVPMRSKNFINKSVAFINERRAEYMGRMRDSRLIKKPDGISEFFKSMSEVEKGGGEINDYLEDSSQEDKKELK